MNNPELYSEKMEAIGGSMEHDAQKTSSDSLSRPELKKNTGRLDTVDDTYNVFDPDTKLKDILRMPTGQRRPALDLWKKNYAKSMEALATFESGLIKRIQSDPDISQYELLAEVDDYGLAHGLTKDQEEMTRSVIGVFAKRHEIIHSFREEHPDDTELFKFLFGSEPVGELKIIEGPITLHFECHSAIDFGRIKTHEQGTVALLKHLAQRYTIGASSGITLTKVKPSSLDGCIIAEDATAKTDDSTGSTRLHEEQHTLHHLFATARLQSQVTDAIIGHNGHNLIEPKTIATYKDMIEERIEDELLAWMRSGAWAGVTQQTLDHMYLGRYIDHAKDLLVEQEEKMRSKWAFAKYGTERCEEALSIIAHTKDQVTSHAFKQKLLDELYQGLVAYEDLRAAKWSHEKIVTLLMDTALPKWPKIVQRVLHPKEKR